MVSLGFQRKGVVVSRVKRSEERSRPRKVTLGLCDRRLCREGIDVVRGDIENPIKLSQRFWETTKHHMAMRVLGEYESVTRIKPLGFVEVRLASVSLALPPRDIGKSFRDLAVIRQELAGLLEVTHCGAVILQTIVVIALGQDGLSETGLKS